MSDGKGCKCHAHCEHECSCDADWTPKEVYDLRAELAAVWRERSEFAKRIDEADATIAQRTAERDEARREVCGLRADLRVKLTLGTQVAAERGWDCFDAKEGKP